MEIKVYVDEQSGITITKEMIQRWVNYCNSSSTYNAVSDRARIMMGLTIEEHRAILNVGLQMLKDYFGID